MGQWGSEDQDRWSRPLSIRRACLCEDTAQFHPFLQQSRQGVGGVRVDRMNDLEPEHTLVSLFIDNLKLGRELTVRASTPHCAVIGSDASRGIDKLPRDLPDPWQTLEKNAQPDCVNREGHGSFLQRV